MAQGCNVGCNSRRAESDPNDNFGILCDGLHGAVTPGMRRAALATTSWPHDTPASSFRRYQWKPGVRRCVAHRRCRCEARWPGNRSGLRGGLRPRIDAVGSRAAATRHGSRTRLLDVTGGVRTCCTDARSRGPRVRCRVDRHRTEWCRAGGSLVRQWNDCARVAGVRDSRDDGADDGPWDSAYGRCGDRLLGGKPAGRALSA
jgi:hypothetical protein